MTGGEPKGPPIVFLGSGAFGLPGLESLAATGRVALVVSQPDRPAGRGQRSQATPISERALALGLPLLRSENVNLAPDLDRIRGAAPIFVVIAFGQKLAPEFVEGRFAINLHGSLLPRWRGAAPIQRAVMEGDREVGVTVISIAERMDAGVIYASATTTVGAAETAGELHDRLAQLGPAVIDEVLAKHAAGAVHGEAQDPSLVTRAKKLSRADAWVDLSQPARLVAARINGLSPWPGCEATIDGAPIKLLRARVVRAGGGSGVEGGVAGSGGSVGGGSGVEGGSFAGEAPETVGQRAAGLSAIGTTRGDGIVRCGEGEVELLEVQPPGGRVMSFEAWRRGRARGESPTAGVLQLRSEPRV